MKYKQQQRINKALRLLDKSFNIKTNVVKINIHNTIFHELAKCAKAYELISEGKQVITEAIFKNGSRADIFVLDAFSVFEILHSETEKEALIKTVKYPAELDIFYLSSIEVLKEILIE